MTFSIGSGSSGMGPGGALEAFGGQPDQGRGIDRRILVRLLAYLKPYWQRMAVALVLMMISTGLALAAPYFVKIAIDQNITDGDVPGLIRTTVALVVVFLALYATTSVEQYL